MPLDGKMEKIMIDQLGKELEKKMAGYQDEMLLHFIELLKIPSVRAEGSERAPFGKACREALDYILRLSEQFGLKTVDMNGYAGYSEYGDGEDYICSVAHLDVVPTGDGWKYPPFAAEIEDGTIYARGAADDKPGCIAGLYALRCLKELGYKPKRRIRVIYGCAEETGMEDIGYYLQHEPLPVFGFTPDSDGYDIVNSEKGRMEFSLSSELPENYPVINIEGGMASNMVPASVKLKICTQDMDKDILQDLERKLDAAKDVKWEAEAGTCHIEFLGASAHAAFPETGKSAISMCASFLSDILGDKADGMTRFINTYIADDWYGKKLGIAFDDDHMGPLTISLGTVKVEDGQIKVIGDIRYPAGISSAEISCKLSKICEEGQLGFEVLSAEDGTHCGCEEEFEILKQVCLDKSKSEPVCRSIAGGTYAKKFSGRLVAFGGCGDSVHAPNEFVPIKDFFDHADMVSYALYMLSNIQR